MLTVISAEPGWALVTPEYLNEGNEDIVTDLHEEPILAWHIDSMVNSVDIPSSYVTAITIEGCEADVTSHIVYKRPDGSYVEPYLNYSLTKTEVLKILQEKHNNKAEK